MKRDKEWLIKELIGREVGDYGNYYNGGYEDGLAYAIQLAYQLDETGKVTVPRVVADWIENVRGLSNSMSCLMTYDQIKRTSHELTVWCYESGNNENLHKLARAWLDGYEIEKEPLYLIRFSDNQYALKDYEGGIRSILVDKKYANQFTRAEIDKLGIEYRGFAIPVEVAE